MFLLYRIIGKFIYKINEKIELWEEEVMRGIIILPKKLL